MYPSGEYYILYLIVSTLGYATVLGFLFHADAKEIQLYWLSKRIDLNQNYIFNSAANSENCY